MWWATQTGEERGEDMANAIIYGTIAAGFYLLPPLILRDTGSGMFLLLLALPLICLVMSFWQGWLKGLWLVHPLIVALLFLPTVWIYYNESALFYVAAYAVIALAGMLLAWPIRVWRNRK